MTDIEKIERRLRRRARSMGCRLRKSKARNPDTPGFGRYGIENVWGCYRGGFYERDGWPLNMTLQEIENTLNSGGSGFPGRGRSRDMTDKMPLVAGSKLAPWEIEIASPDIPAMKEKALRQVRFADSQVVSAMNAAWRAGELLLNLKAQLKHGEFGAWLLESGINGGGNFLWSKCQDLGKSSILFSHNIFCGVLPPPSQPEIDRNPHNSNKSDATWCKSKLADRDPHS